MAAAETEEGSRGSGVTGGHPRYSFYFLMFIGHIFPGSTKRVAIFTLGHPWTSTLLVFCWFTAISVAGGIVLPDRARAETKAQQKERLEK